MTVEAAAELLRGALLKLLSASADDVPFARAQAAAALAFYNELVRDRARLRVVT